MKRVGENGILVDKPALVRTCLVRSIAIISAVTEGVHKQSTTSIRYRSQQLDISHISLTRIFRKDLPMSSIGASAKVEDFEFYRKIIFSYKNYFLRHWLH